jgi:HTH-type transcriptional regulator/antitoxin HipB
MIRNDKQLKITRDWLQRFEENIDKVNGDTLMNPYLKEAQLSAFRNDIWKFNKEIHEYEELKAGNTNSLSIPEFRLVYEAIIKARIAKGWTQAELAEKVGLQEQAIQRYEANDYATASLPRLDEIIYALGINMSLHVTNLTKPHFLVPNDLVEDALQVAGKTIKNKRNLIPA